MPETTYLYDGAVAVEFIPETHKYLITDAACGLVSQPCPSVTGVIGVLDKSDALIPWACNEMGRRVLELLKASSADKLTNNWHLAWLVEHAKDTWKKTRQTAADIGSTVHFRLEAELYRRSGLPFEKPAPAIELPIALQSQADAAFDAGCRYFDTRSLTLVESETPRWSRELQVVGTQDLIAYVDGVLSVCDFKTSSALRPTIWIQTAAYQRMFEQEYPDQAIQQRVGINVRKDGVLDVQPRDNSTLEADYEAFKALTVAYRWSKANSVKRADK